AASIVPSRAAATTIRAAPAASGQSKADRGTTMQPDDTATYRFHMQANGLAAPTIKNYLVAHKQWRRWCEANSIDPATATKSLMMAFLADGAARNMSGTVRLLTLGLRAYGDFLVSQGVRTDNPARTIKPVKQNSRP